MILLKNENQRSYRLFIMTTYQFFSIKNVQAENAVQFSKTGYQVTADDVTVTF